jgi:hypothetical protein
MSAERAPSRLNVSGDRPSEYGSARLRTWHGGVQWLNSSFSRSRNGLKSASKREERKTTGVEIGIDPGYQV